MKKQCRRGRTSLIGTFGIGGLFAYLAGVVHGYIQGFTWEHKAVKRVGGLLLSVTALALVFFIFYLAAPILPQIKQEAEIEASVAKAAEEEKEINLTDGEETEVKSTELPPKAGNIATTDQELIVDSKAPVISLRLQNEKDWCKENTIYVSAEDSLQVEYRYICSASGEDSGWIKESSKKVSANGTWTIQVRDAAGNTAEQEITVDNIDTRAPVIRSITENIVVEGEAVKNEE